MPLEELFWNKPQYLEFEQQEFYATGLYADAVVIALMPGIAANAQILQLGEEDATSFTQYSFWSDEGIHGDWFKGVYDQPETQASVNVDRMGSSQPFLQQTRVQLPGVQLAPGKINGQEWVYYEQNCNSTPHYVGTGTPTWYSDSQFIPYNTLNKVHNMQRFLMAPRLPGVEFEIPFLKGETIIETTGILLIRLVVTNEGKGYGRTGDQVRVFRNLGRIAFGHY